MRLGVTTWIVIGLLAIWIVAALVAAAVISGPTVALPLLLAVGVVYYVVRRGRKSR
jgi:hypothetical protein